MPATDRARPKRALWLMNHTTLRAFEVPLIQSFGYEVYLPKSFPYDEGNLSASVDYAYDSALTLDERDLETLNTKNLYTTLDDETVEIINRNFDVAFMGFFPEQLSTIVQRFDHTIIMRPFGLANGVTYTHVISAHLGMNFFRRLESAGSRFWFGQAYPNLAEIEEPPLRSRAVTLPLGLADTIGTPWKGDLKQVLFVCPRIGTSSYFRNVYLAFKELAKNLPHAVAGAQPIPVPDERVLGYLTRQAYDDVLSRSRVMYYHSQEKRHLHYHPLEAVKIGMPLIFMADGMLDELGGRTLPGRAASVEEAQKKLKRVLDGDRRFTREIIASQKTLLKEFSLEHCRDEWRKNFTTIAAANTPRVSPPRTRRPARVACILNEGYRGGTLEVAKAAAKMLASGSRQAGEPCEVAFYHLEQPLYSDADFADLAQEGIARGRFSWKLVDRPQLEAAMKLAGNTTPLSPDDTFSVPDDGINGLLQYDHWLFLTDRFPYAVAPLRPYSVYVHDCLQRYWPQLYGPTYEHAVIESVRNATQTLCSTDLTVDDVIHYIGVNPKRVKLVPLVTELAGESSAASVDPSSQTADQAPRYFVWPTNAASHKNHENMIRALEAYYEQHASKLTCIVTGVNTHLLDPDCDPDAPCPDHAKAIRQILDKSGLVGERLVIKGEMPRKQYWKLIAGAQFVVHPALIDNGTLVTVEAGSSGVPMLSHDYPPMRFYERRFEIPIQFMDATSPEDITRGLAFMEHNIGALRRTLPNRPHFQRFHWRAEAPAFWKAVRSEIV